MVHRLIQWGFILYLISTAKALPLAYVARFYFRLLLNLGITLIRYRNNGKKNTFGITGTKNKLDLFEYTTFRTYVAPLEIDPYFHKSNSTYFTDLDIARTDLVTKIFQKCFIDSVFNVNKEFKRPGLQNAPYVPVASIQCIFKRELTLFQRYNIKSKVLAWDGKWLFILSKFVLPGAKETVCAIAVTRYVFKNVRKTIPPVQVIKSCNLYNEEVEKVNAKNYELIKYMRSTEDLETACSEF